MRSRSARRRRRRSPRAQSASGLLSRSACHRVAEARDQLGEAPGELDRAAVDVVERQHAREQPLAVLGHRHAEQQPPQSRLPGAAVDAAEPVARAVGGVEPPADPGLRDPVLQPGQIVVVEPEAPADRRRGRRGRAPARRSAAARRARAARTRRRAPGWSGAASGRRAGPAGRSAAGRRRPAEASSFVGRLAGAERGLDQRRERLDVRAHHDHVARLEARSSASACRIASRITSTWRARPWQEWTSIERSSGSSSGRASGLPGSGAPGAAAVGADVGLDPAQQRRRPGARRATARRRTRAARRPRARAAARARRDPRRRAGGWPAASRSGRRRGGSGPGRRGAAAATLSHSAAEGCSRNRCTSRCRASARRTCRCPAGSRVSPNSENRSGSSTSARSSARRSQAPPRRSAGPGIPIRARSRRHSSACQRGAVGERVPGRVEVAPVGPGRQHRRAGAARTGRTACEVADDAQPARLLDRIGRLRRCGRGRRPASRATARRCTARRPPAAATRRARAATDRPPGRCPRPRRWRR